MPYRIDFRGARDDMLDRLVELGALDVERTGDRAAALMPDRVAPEQVAGALGIAEIAVAPAAGRDAGSVWLLNPRPVRIGRLQIVPAHMEAEPGALRLIDATAFGTGLHPTTALCLEALDEATRHRPPAALLDVGTGSAVLALGALLLDVRRALGIDVDENALGVAAENARINGLDERLRLVRGTVDAVRGSWPLVVANVLAAPLVEMAPALVRRVGHHGQLVLSGIPSSVEQDVAQAYRQLGMRCMGVTSRAGWIAMMWQAGW